MTFGLMLFLSVGGGPPRPRIVASLRDWCGVNWVVEYSSNAVVLRSQPDCHEDPTKQQTFRLPPGWGRANRLLFDVRFRELPEKIEPSPPPDSVTVGSIDLCIETGEPVEHKVCVDMSDIKSAPDAKRFTKLWDFLVSTPSLPRWVGPAFESPVK